MRRVFIIASLCAFLSFLTLGWGQRSSSEVPGEFTIGRHTFVDFGPPLDFYEIFKVQTNSKGTSVEKITLTPAANVCTSPAHVEVQAVFLDETLEALLDPLNPCEIPKKSIKGEMNRGKKGPVFSGAEVIMEIRCNSKIRRIKSSVLDRDMFDSAPDTPKYTSWTMQLLDKLNKPLGPGVLDKPMFPSLAKNEPLPHQVEDSQTLADVCAGMFDTLFEKAPDKLSELCHEAEKPPPPPPTVRLMSSAPVQPTSYVLPTYPPIARLARLEGTVSFLIDADSNGTVIRSSCEQGHPILCRSAESEIGHWKFPPDSSDRQFHVQIEFALNCHEPSKPN